MNYILNGLPYFPGTTIFGTGLFADGTAAAPSISFAADTDTGFYRHSGNVVGLSIGGVDQFRWGGTVMQGGAGLGGYISLPATGEVSLVAGGTAKNITLTPSGTGGVLIGGGTLFPYTAGALALNINAASSAQSEIKLTNSTTGNSATAGMMLSCAGNDAYVWNGQVTGALYFGTANATRALFLASGRFLLGTGTDSGALLQVGTNTTTSAGGIVFGTDTFLYRSAAGTLELARSGTAVLALNNIGNRTSTITGTAAGYEIDATGGGGTGIFKTSGTTALTLDSSQNATFAQRVRTADGTLALPGHAFTNDNASGMYRPATNTLGFSSGGVLSLTLDGYGAVVCGPAALGTTTTDGFFYLRAMAGAPTGVPTAYTGRVAATYDSTNNRLYIYNGGWKSVVLI